jgi:hypothetical protein
MEFDFGKIKLLLNIKYYTNLINTCQKNNIESSFLEIKKNSLLLQNTNINTISDTEKSETIEKSENIDYLYTKSWNKLNQIHKVIKIKEFINSLEIKENDKEELRENLIDMLKDKKNKNKINYDEVKCKIINIPLLTFVDGKYKLSS